MTRAETDPAHTTGAAAARPVRILLADGQQLLRSGFRMVLGAQPDLDVAGEAADGADAVALARRLLPDVVVLDLQLPRRDGIAATREIADSGLPVQVLVLAAAACEDDAAAALGAGATGFLAKDVHPADLVVAIRAVAAGEAVVAPTVLRQLVDRFTATLPAPQPQVRGLDGLTEREREVLAQVARGKSNQEIAETLRVGETTVKTHVGNVLTKLGLRDRVQAVVTAYESGLVRPGHTARDRR